MSKTMPRLLKRSLIGSLLFIGCARAQNAPDPFTLLQGLESIRLQIPPSSLKIKFSYRDHLVTNETIMSVDFDGNFRGFNAVSPVEDHGNYQTAFDGERAICYEESMREVTYRSIADQRPLRLFDPRVIGISSYYNWVDSTENTLPYRFNPSKIELIGRENVGNLPAWHVRLTLIVPEGNAIWDYWVDDTREFRLYRADYNGVQSYSYYEDDSYPWLPRRVVSKEYRYSPDGAPTIRAERGLEILEAKANVTLPKSRWTLAGMSIKPGTDVSDGVLQRRIGTWDGKRLVPPGSSRTYKPPGRWTYAVCVAMLGFPLVIWWISKRRAA